MKVISIKDSLNSITQDLLVLVCSPEDLKKKNAKSSSGLTLAKVDNKLGKLLTKKIKDSEFAAKDGQSFLLNGLSKTKFGSLLLLGWEGKKKSEFEQKFAYRKLAVNIFDQAEKLKAQSVCLSAQNLDVQNPDNLLALYEGLNLSSYSFTRYKSGKKSTYGGPKQLAIAGANSFSRQLAQLGELLCEATVVARDLINMPARDCTPSVLRDKCKELAKTEKLKIDVLGRAELKRLGAGALLAVAQGSSEPPFLIKMTYKPKKKAAQVISLVGKGVTFDSGGLSIKSASGMETMKYDMAGAAAVIGAMSVISRLAPSIEVRAYIPTTENMISGNATRPGDVVSAMNGKFIEILNTDAEGRLILADALCLAVKDKTDYIIDLATLTGACVVALGPDYAGMFSNNEKLLNGLSAAAELSGERLWRMPLAPEYKEMLKSPLADLKNTGGPWGGAITAALFLSEFVGDANWAHLDIAGPAFAEAAKGHIKKGGVGFGVRTLLRFLLNFKA